MNDDRSNERVESVVGDSIRAENASWTFSNDVAQTFADHVRKSIPMYDEGHDLICKISDFFLGADSICYDLGTSTGTLLERLARHNSNKSVHFVGIDAEKSMIDKAKSTAPRSNNIQYVVEDIANYNFEQADMMVSYYTMQFIHPKKRQLVIDKVYQSLNWGGSFIMFEKVRGCDARFQDIASAIYVDYKIDKGYSSDEIVAKARSLKGILEPFSTAGNLDLLRRAGFLDIMSIYKYVCFEGFLCIK